MAYFPFYMDINDKTCVVIGGGKIALRKIEILLQFGARIKVVALNICEEIYRIQENMNENKGEQIILIERDFIDKDICNAEFVVAATNEEALNSYISDICRKNKILVNVVDVKDECSFLFPAILKRDELVIAISTGGASPSMAAKIRRDIETVIPEYYGELIELLGEHREFIKTEVHLPEQRKQVYNELIRLAEINEGNLTVEMIQKEIDKVR